VSNSSETEGNLQTIRKDHFYDFASLTKEELLLKKTIHKIRTAITKSRKVMKSIHEITDNDA